MNVANMSSAIEKKNGKLQPWNKEDRASAPSAAVLARTLQSKQQDKVILMHTSAESPAPDIAGQNGRWWNVTGKYKK